MSALVTFLVLATALTGRAATRSTRRLAVRRRLRSRQPAPGSQAVASGLLVNLPDPPALLARWLQDAGVEADGRLVWSGWLVAVLPILSGALLVAGPGAAVFVAVLVTLAPVLALRARRGQGELRIELGLPAALEAVARSLRSGASLRQAVAEAGDATPGQLGRELTDVARHVEHGAPLVAALERMAERRPSAGVRLAVAALCLGVETGGAQARAVDGVAATLRDRLGVAAEVRALSSQARISALVIGLAPLAFGAFAMTTDSRTADFLFRTPAGLVLLTVGVVLDGAGWLWMQRLAKAPA